MLNYRRIQTIVAALVCFMLLAVLAPASSTSSDGKPITQGTFIQTSKQALPAVVSINVKKTMTSSLPQGGQMNEEQMKKFFGDRGQNPEDSFPSPFRFFFRTPDEQGEIEVPAAGSGVIIRPEGYVVTNFHVIADAKNGDISVKLNDDIVIEGDNVEVVGQDKFTDLAVLKLKTDKKLPYLAFADSEQSEIGQWVLALGNPLELKGSVSQGIISAKHRVIGKALIEDLIQTTAAINPGNSGGPLVDLDGNIVGINSAIASNTGLWQGVGFAIPSNTVKNVCESIIDTGKAKYGWLGIHMSELNPGILSYYSLKDIQGILVAKVIKDSPAEKADLKTYDIITAVDGNKIKNRLEMLQQIARKKVGTDVKIELFRPDGKKAEQKTVTVTLGERPAEEDFGSKPAILKSPGKEKGYEDFGIMFIEKIEGDNRLGLEVESVKPGSSAAKGGIQPGDRIVELNRVKVNSIDDFRKALDEAKDEKTHLIMFERGNEIMFSTIEK